MSDADDLFDSDDGQSSPKVPVVRKKLRQTMPSSGINESARGARSDGRTTKRKSSNENTRPKPVRQKTIISTQSQQREPLKKKQKNGAGSWKQSLHFFLKEKETTDDPPVHNLSSPVSPAARIQQGKDVIDLTGVVPSHLQSGHILSSSSSSSYSSSSSSSSSFRPRRSSGTQLWTDKYAPVRTADLCMHTKKIADIRNWLVRNLEVAFSSTAQPVLILSGPPGAAKSAVVRALASEHGLRLVQWESPVQSSRWKNPEDRDESNRPHQDVAMPYESQLENFRQFVLRSIKYPALSFGGTTKSSSPSVSEHSSSSRSSSSSSAPMASGQLVLIEELPVGALLTRADSRAMFQDTLKLLLNSARHLVVLVLSDANDMMDKPDNILGDAVLSHLRLAHIRCNPISSTGLKKAITRVAKGERLKISQEEITALVESSVGDVRSALNALQFNALLEPVPSKKLHAKKAKSESSSDTLDRPIVGRDQSLSIFRAAGKVLHAKAEARTNPEEVVARAEISPAAFVESIHSNCIDHMPSSDSQSALDGLSVLLSDLSYADLFVEATSARFGNSTSALPEQYGASVAARGFLCAKDAQPSRDQQPSHWKPKSWQSLRGSLNRTVQTAVESRHRAARTFVGQSNEFLPLHLGVLFQEDLPWLHMISKASGKSQLTPAWFGSFSGKYELRPLKAVLTYASENQLWTPRAIEPSSRVAEKPLDRGGDVESSDVFDEMEVIDEIEDV
eukprot:gb/GEZN01002843.1/.p1 GENE.gb/GEZN01002843.1/~~gb/GEZN01002843.1/.p1  ORF type:complete len:734 (-),score=88.29 gb/GEZN01002843.1/:58-2259(-)